MISLSGASGTGKSTLAYAYADKHGLNFVASRAGDVFKSFGVTVGDKIPVGMRLDIQDAILNGFLADIKAAEGPWISDRSPLDMAAFVLADLADEPALDWARALAYVDRCIWEANRHCSTIILVQPGVPLVFRENRPIPNPVAQERLNAVLWGLMEDVRLHSRCAFLGRHLIGMEARLDAVENLSEHIIQTSLKELDGGAAIH